MALNPSRLAYQDCYEVMEKAISDDFPVGLRVKFASQNEAIHFRQRLHNARQVDRTENMKLYPEGHVLWGHSIYDVISCRVRNSAEGWWLRLERVDARAEEFIIESLETPEPSPVVVQNGGGGNLVVEMVPIQPKFPRRF